MLTETIQLDDCVIYHSYTPSTVCDAVPCTAAQSVNELCKKKEAPMGRYYDDDLDCYVETANRSDLAATRDYLACRLSDVASEKYDQARKDFYMDDDARPSSATELLKRIADGKFIAPDPVKDQAAYDACPWGYNLWRAIKWRDPSKPADEAGYEKALVAIRASEIDAKDVIKTGTEKDGLEALKAFKAQTFH